MLRTLLDGRPEWGEVVAAIATAIIVAYLTSEIAARLVRVALTRALGRDRKADDARVRRSVWVTRASAFLLTMAALLVPLLGAIGVHLGAGPPPRVVATWLLESGLRIVLIAVGAYVLVRLVGLSTERFENELSQGEGLDVVERGRRARTLGRLIRNVVGVTVGSIAALMILRELRVDIMPVLTGAGIIGLAIGFGAQTLVKDVIAGFFLILENQVRVGDSAVINGTAGEIETINLRTIVLRDAEGAVHVFPNGAVQTLSNRSKEYGYFVAQVAVSYRTDLDRAIGALHAAGEAVRADPRHHHAILEPLDVLGIESFEDSRIQIKFRIKTLPQQRIEIGRALMRQIKRTFDAEKIAPLGMMR
ncbi:MAG: mechanosensitive ion channel [Acidobacteria bacterium]|nr:mechanosensitive ion channel [Acidobacteriota bacterium]